MLAFFIMINCPRCGFEQPKDRFCAKCGVDMDDFAEKNPKKTKIYDRYGLWIGASLAILLIIGVLFFLNMRSSQNEVGEIKPLPIPTPLAAENRPLAQPPTAPKTPRAASRNLRPPEENRIAAPTNPEPSSKEPTSVNVEFSLANKDVMERLVQEAEGRLEIGRYSVALVSQMKNRLDAVKGDTGFRILTTESRALVMGQPSLIFQGGREPKNNEAIGFFVEVTPLRVVPDRGTEYKVSVKISLPEVVPPNDLSVTSQNFDESFVIPPGGGLIFGGLLPRKPLFEGEDRLYRTNLLKALLDPGFQRMDSEFLMILNLI